ncbi:SMI1/KNR4 family protein [Psychrobacter sp. NG25]|uniref:SMI1/KNR4 family protein n=1 Tax=Psychrobacter sp. NG25 TaxID=2782005 RepID=UPI001883E19D|nr:SMI1/KNR4 family protein [Psychrobacter sp. NG25]MBF0658501.1 SMI1/KNR4 family protein [Psychrobacter sp. NG25]
MIKNYLKEAFKIIENNPFDDAYFVGPKSENLILDVEKVLDLILPTDFLTFVKKYGAGSILGNEFYGVIDDNFYDSSIPNFAWLTLQSREEYCLPKKFAVVAESVEGNYIILDCSSYDEETNLVLEWIPSLPIEMQEMNVVAKSYAQFLFETLQESLQ